jgi:hypothetical protein
VTHYVVGAQRDYAIAGRGDPAETLLVRAPAWAKRMEVDLQLPPDFWDELTDFTITVYDSTGQQLPDANEAVNYAFGRLSFELADSLAGRRLTVELYPAFARRTGHPWPGRARVRFLGPERAAGSGGELSVVAGGRAAVALPVPLPPNSGLEPPAGFAALIETRVIPPEGGVTAARRTGVEGGTR